MTTEIAANATSGAAFITGAVKRASVSTGTGFDFLMKMAARESSFDPNAKAKTSSAAGLFQFIEQTWLSTVKNYGADHGLGASAEKISRNANGRYEVADPAARAQILNLRFDPDAASAMAGELASENQSMLEGRLGRAVNSADLYTAHFLGPAGAVKLLSAASTVKAADLLPQAAAANRNVFYDGPRAKSVGEVVASIGRSMSGSAPQVPSHVGGGAERGVDGAPALIADASTGPRNTRHSASSRAYADRLFDAFTTPAPRTALQAGAIGYSAMALAVIDALDPGVMREERDNGREEDTTA